MARATARARTVGLLMLDLDGFKAINDTLTGHAAGDEGAARGRVAGCSRSVRERDMVARLGGDESLLVVLRDLGGPSGAVRGPMARSASP